MPGLANSITWHAFSHYATCSCPKAAGQRQPPSAHPYGLAVRLPPLGYIRLELPVFHIGYFKNTIQILQCICKTCSRVMLHGDLREQQLRFGPGLPHVT